MPTKKPSKTSEVIDKIFGSSEIAYGLKEFSGTNFSDVLEIIEDEKDRFAIKDIKSGEYKFVWDEKKQKGRPEEIVRQLWLHKLRNHYGFSLERIDTERSVSFGREIHKKAVDIVVFKKDNVTPYIMIEVKAPTESKGIEQLN